MAELLINEGTMKTRRLQVRAVSFVLAAALAVVVLASGTPAVAAKDNFKIRFLGDLFTDYTDNLYRLSDEELREFDDLQAPGQRFFNMPSSDDVIIRLRLRGDFDWRIAKKRKVRLMLRGSYYGHGTNTIADYPRFEIALSGDLTKRDNLYGGVDLIYDRFWKNLRVATTRLFAPGIYDPDLGEVFPISVNGSTSMTIDLSGLPPFSGPVTFINNAINQRASCAMVRQSRCIDLARLKKKSIRALLRAKLHVRLP